MLYRITYFGLLLIMFSVATCNKASVKTKTSKDIYNSYSINHKATYFKVSPGIVSIFLDESQKGNTELKDLLTDVRELSFLIISKDSDDKKNHYLDDLNCQLDSINFYDLAQINNGKEIIRVKADKSRKHFDELVVLVSNKDAVYCISFKGRIHPKKVVNLIKQENVGAVANLNRFKR